MTLIISLYEFQFNAKIINDDKLKTTRGEEKIGRKKQGEKIIKETNNNNNN